MNVVEKIILKKIKHKVSNWFELERSVEKLDGVFHSVEDSPEKSWPNPDKIPSGKEVPFSIKNIPIVGPSLSSSIKEGNKAIKSLSNNPARGKTIIDDLELKQFEAMAKENGIGAIGYTKLPHHLIFKDRAVLYDTAIVLIMEMNKEAVMKAPSLDTFKMVMSTYDTLGKTTNLLTEQLRIMGFQAQASHPLGGLVVYPPLAVEAGLGWCGRHGLLITPQFGASQRIAAIFVNIENLPLSEKNYHSWIGDFCENCGKCIRKCPSQAIYEEPIEHQSGRKTHINREKCLPIFVSQQGCTVCVKECTFTKINYSIVHDRFVNRKGRTQKN
ncbi:4Fe-4S dicluster domain-containing protein [Bacillus tuaregi]|uniref:4Fe-4S dicluster domain-containing protein n=1 Tax=Bacillus tuaregi TaxID=1816695 RepID=UPI0008F94E85|nr:4Fe-4S dicluster domain-containing protein [Bacillus tuaregi]